MEKNFLKHVYDCFAKFTGEFGFSKENELNNEQFYSIEYRSNIFVIKLQKYRREFYATVYKTGNSDKEINLFNLLRYLNPDSSIFSEFKYFYGKFNGENELEEYYIKQLKHISDTIFENFKAIKDFFSSGNYESKVADLEKFMLYRYPDLFKRT